MKPLTPHGAHHAKVHEAFELLQRGRMDRRSFVRTAALLGVAASAAYAMAGLDEAAASEPLTNSPFPKVTSKPEPGGVLRVAMQVQALEDPATFSWPEMGNQARHTLEYLAMTGPDDVTRPMLAESWEASRDLKTWTFKLRRGVRWHNGDELKASHVVASYVRAMDPALGAGGVVGLSTFSAMLEDVAGAADENGNPTTTKRMIDGAITAPDDETVVFSLTKPVLSVPEDLYNYPCAIVHPSFKAPISNETIGTGPFRFASLEVGKKCVLTRVKKLPDGSSFSYWGGEVYLDEIHYLNYDEADQLRAFATGEVDAVYEFGVEQFDLAQSLDGQVVEARSSQTLCLRMQVTQPPFDNALVRQAVLLAVDNTFTKSLVYPRGGDVGENHHVAPLHPEYSALPPQQRDVARAKQLLAEAGYPDGLELTIDVGNTDGAWHQTVAEVVRDQLREAGITLRINVMAPEKYWTLWNKTSFGATAWTHRPLGTMAMSLGYRSGVPWNETHFANPEFDAALDEAEATLDIDERRARMAKAQQLLQDSACLLLPIFRPVYALVSPKVGGYPAHPAQYHQFNKVHFQTA
ncbi:MAG: ABC transporter substrate-binding protein [Pseudomonadota bacterium]